MNVSNKLAVKRTVAGLATAGLVSGLLLVGCGGAASPGTSAASGSSATPLAAQTGQQSYLFYGKSDHTKLLSIRDVTVMDPSKPSTALIYHEGTPSGGVSGTFPTASGAQPKPSTAVDGFKAADNSYTDLYVNSLHYVEGGKPYKVSLKKETGVAVPAEQPHSNATGLTNPVYKEIDYLGTRLFLTAKDANNKDVLICPMADGSSVPMPFDKKTLFTIAYDSYGAAPTGIIAHNTLTGLLEHAAPSTASCAACGIMGEDAVFTPITTGSPAVTPSTVYKFLGDIGGTSKSMLLIDGALYVLEKNKTALSLTPVPLNPSTATFPATSTKTFAFNGDSAYFVNTSTKTITRLKSDGTVSQVNSDGNASKIHAFTNNWVIYGNADNSMSAVRKDGTTTTPVVLSVTTQTTGHRISNSNMAFGDKHLYTTYRLDTKAGKMTYQACMLQEGRHDMNTHTDYPDEATVTCRDNGFWAALTAAKKGTLNFNASFPYTPYALLRVDVTDDNGGGTLVVVDPAAPLANGSTMGSVPNYSFDTFMQQYNYRTKMIDSDGYVVIYGKDDLNVKGDAFLVNLNKTNSLVNLTNEAPAGNEISASTNAAHCHGRTCATCHAFAAGKIYADKTSTSNPVGLGHNIRFEFKDGTKKTARKGKGQGENFNLPLSDIVDSFTAVLVTESDVEVRRSNPYSHGGKEFANCDLCHHLTPPANITSQFTTMPGRLSIAP